MIDNSVRKLVCYGLSNGLLTGRDEIFVTNRLLEILHLDQISDFENYTVTDLEPVLKELLDYAVSENLIDDTVTERDLFDTKLMGALLPRPSEVTEKFFEDYKVSPRLATDNYFKFSCDSDYIRRYRIKKDLKWTAPTEYGNLDITINLSKPEKDPKAIAAAKNAPQSGYPKCLLCKECEGYAGRLNFPARQNHRVIPITLANESFFMQYSPYVYYNEHCIVFNSEHTPMKVDIKAVEKLLDFIDLFPHYFIGSNAGLPIVGGSILSHEHFQGGRYTFAMEKAEIEEEFEISGIDNLKAGRVKWPMSVIRLSSENKESVLKAAKRVFDAWDNYSDETVGIFAFSGGEPHNAITPIARKKDGAYELDLVLRNNITTEEFPLGVFHPHPELHHIKKENIGLIEVMGLAVLPARLKGEISKLASILVSGGDCREDEELVKHADWVDELKRKYGSFNEMTVHNILKDEIGIVFKKVLEDAGVFKRDEQGIAAFKKFTETL